jgi:cytochrome c5
VSKVDSNFGFSMGVAIVVGALVLGINALVGSALKGDVTEDMSDAAIAERIKPVAQLNTGAPIVPETAAATAAPVAAAGGARSGKDIYQSTCFACHGTGAAGAPMFGNAEAWAPRISQGIDTLLNHAINGLRAMPPRGTCGSCSDDDLKAAIEYMVENSK